MIMTDASWIDDPRDRSTTLGLAVFVGRCLVDWRSHSIKRIMTSTNHAEFYASNEGTKAAVALECFRKELGRAYKRSRIAILGDNEKALALARGHVTASKCRHYDLLLFYQREQYELGLVDFIYIPTDMNLSDLFTKGRFSKDHFASLVDQLMGQSIITAFSYVSS